MAPAKKAKKKTTKKVAKKVAKKASGRRSRRVKCACASCVCTVDVSKGFRKGNLVFCNRICASRCTIEQCFCEHDACHV